MVSNILFKEEQYKKMLQRGKMNTYGRVLCVSTKKVNRTLNVLETIIPMTFFTLSIVGFIICKVFGDELRIPLEE